MVIKLIINPPPPPLPQTKNKNEKKSPKTHHQIDSSIPNFTWSKIDMA